MSKCQKNVVVRTRGMRAHIAYIIYYYSIRYTEHSTTRTSKQVGRSGRTVCIVCDRKVPGQQIQKPRSFRAIQRLKNNESVVF